MNGMSAQPCDLSALSHALLQGEPTGMQMGPEDMVRLAIVQARRTQLRIQQLNLIRTRTNPPLNTTDRDVVAQFSYLTRHASVLSDDEYQERVHQLVKRNYVSLHTVTVWIDDLLDEIGLVGNVALREEATKLLLGEDPEDRAQPGERMKKYKELFDTAERKQKMKAWRDKLHADYPNLQKIKYKPGRSARDEGNMQSLYSL